MKNLQKGFATIPLIIAIVAVLVIAGGVYFYETKTKSPADTDIQSQNNLSDNTSSAICGDFATLSDYVLKNIQKPDGQGTMQMNKNVITSFHWKRKSGEPFITYPIINGVQALYGNQETNRTHEFIVSAIKNDSDTLSKIIDEKTKNLGLIADPLNTLPFQSFSNQDIYLRTFAFQEGGSLYSITLKVEGGGHQAPPVGVVTVTCGKAVNEYDKVYSALNFKADVAVQDAYDNDYVAIADVSYDNKVYALLGSSNHIKIANYYDFDGITAKLVSKDSYPTQCAPLESQRVGKGMRCADANYNQRTVDYSSVSTPTAQQNPATATTNTPSVKKSYCTSENYTVKSGVEYWGANPMKADPATFEVLPRFPDDGGFDLCLSQDASNLFSAERIVTLRPQHMSYLQLQGTKNCKAYRVVDGVGIFEGVFLLSGSDARTFVDLTPADGEKQGMCYGKDKNQVYSAYGVGGFGPIVGGDPQTFKILNANYTKDANHVWNRGNPIPNADANTFVASGELWAKDKNNVYHWDKIISGADTTTFVALDDDHGKDATHAFDPFGNVFKQIVDVGSLTSVNSFWLKDKFHVYTSNGQILDQADPVTFADLGSGYGRDVSHVFYGNTGTFGSGKGNVISDADLTSFMVVADNYGKDNAHIFSLGKVLSSADVNTFARIGESAYFKDKSHVWYRGDGPGGLTLIPEADSTTFVLTDSSGYGGAKDANHTYGFSAKGFFYVK